MHSPTRYQRADTVNIQPPTRYQRADTVNVHTLTRYQRPHTVKYVLPDDTNEQTLSTYIIPHNTSVQTLSNTYSHTIPTRRHCQYTNSHTILTCRNCQYTYSHTRSDRQVCTDSSRQTEQAGDRRTVKQRDRHIGLHTKRETRIDIIHVIPTAETPPTQDITFNVSRLHCLEFATGCYEVKPRVTDLYHKTGKTTKPQGDNTHLKSRDPEIIQLLMGG